MQREVYLLFYEMVKDGGDDDAATTRLVGKM